MTTLARKLMDGSSRMVLTFLFVLGVMDGHAAEYALNVTAGASRAWESDAIFAQAEAVMLAGEPKG